MKLRYHAIIKGKIQRSIVEDSFHQFFRRWANGNWQERIHTGDYHNIIDPQRVAKLEAEFHALPEATEKQIQDW